MRFITEPEAKLKGAYGGGANHPPNSRFRRAQRKFAGQNFCLFKAVQGTQSDLVSFDVGEFFRGYYVRL